MRQNTVLRALVAPFRRAARILFALGALFVLVGLVHRERRRARQAAPRIFWCADTFPSTRTLSEAAQLRGYPTSVVGDTEVEELMIRAPAVGRLPRFARRLLASYWTFAWALPRFDIFAFHTDATILRPTPLRRRELQLLHLAGKKILLLPYGPDVEIPSRTRNLPFKHALSIARPSEVRAERRRLSDLEYCSRYADYIVSGADWVDYMPWWDKLTAGVLAVDVNEWTAKPQERADGPVVVLHAPGGGELDGTRFLVQACAELEAEGVPIELRVVERGSNETMQRLMQEADIVADQFLLGWYAQTALEGMSMEKPVLCYLRADLLELYTLFSFAGACPVVNAPPQELTSRLRELATDPDRRSELGRLGRRYVLEHHSLETVGALFDGIFTTLWPREAL